MRPKYYHRHELHRRGRCTGSIECNERQSNKIAPQMSHSTHTGHFRASRNIARVQCAILSGSEGGGGKISTGRSTMSQPSRSVSLMSPMSDARRDLRLDCPSARLTRRGSPPADCRREMVVAVALAAVRDSAMAKPAWRVNDACAQEAVPSRDAGESAAALFGKGLGEEGKRTNAQGETRFLTAHVVKSTAAACFLALRANQ